MLAWIENITTVLLLVIAIVILFILLLGLYEKRKLGKMKATFDNIDVKAKLFSFGILGQLIGRRWRHKGVSFNDIHRLMPTMPDDEVTKQERIFWGGVINALIKEEKHQQERPPTH